MNLSYESEILVTLGFKDFKFTLMLDVDWRQRTGRGDPEAI
jgi:hypothetical protein